METLERSSSSSSSPLQLQSPPPILHPSNLDYKISPSILLIIIILAIIFFISGLLHLLVRFLLKPNRRDPDEIEDVTALQGQLQQLFYLHDAGVDQSCIDTLPLFHYSSIIGVKDPFDCAVCLCEFEPDDRLRLLPKCSHAFHVECIDTWLLSHSTCPLCRSNLLDGFSPVSGRVPVVCVLESGSDGSREMGGQVGRTDSGFGSGHYQVDVELGSGRVEFPRNSIVAVKLGKFRNVDGLGECSANNNNNNVQDNDNRVVVDSRRCYSMGSFAYMMDENLSLQVPIRTVVKKPVDKKPGFVALKQGGYYRSAVSEYGAESTREFGGINKIESFSVSKIWVRKEKGGSSSNVAEIDNVGSMWENGGDEETHSCYSVESTAMANTTTTSTTTRTLLWLMGRQQNKVVHSSNSSSNL